MSVYNIIMFAGACIAFYIGAGFATMQEIMQYEASYGNDFIFVVLVAAVIYIYTNWSFIRNGNRYNLDSGGDIYEKYCGNVIGKIFKLFSSFFCYMCFIVMCGGANSTAIEQWGMPNGIGAIVMALMAVLTVMFGLNGVLNSLSKIGPMIIIFVCIVAVGSVIATYDGYSQGASAISNNIYDIVQVGEGNPVAAGASYGGFVILWFAAFLSEVGAKHKVNEVNNGMLLSAVAIFGVSTLCCIALISNIDITWEVGVPALVLANAISPVLATIFALIIFLGIYTSAVPLLWTGVRIIADDGTIKYKVTSVILGIVGCVIACFFSYKGLLNVLYGINGYLGFVLVGFMIVHDIKNR